MLQAVKCGGLNIGPIGTWLSGTFDCDWKKGGWGAWRRGKWGWLHWGNLIYPDDGSDFGLRQEGRERNVHVVGTPLHPESSLPSYTRMEPKSHI